MLFSPPLTLATITERINRFQAMIQYSQSQQICYVPNTGSMKTAWIPKGDCAVITEYSDKKKSPHTLVMTRDQRQHWVGIHTGLTNRLVKEFLQHWSLTSLYQPEHYELLSEKTIGRSRFDFMLIPKSIPVSGLSASERETKKVILLEVKNVSMIDEAHPNVAQFPDSVSTRAQKHVEDFIALQGASAAPSGFPELTYQTILLFVVQRDHCTSFRPAQLIDPRYAALLREASQKGVLLLAYGCQMSLEEIKIKPQNPLVIEL